MASFRRHGNGWQAEVFKRGVRRAQTFESKGAARAWAHQLEAEIMAGVRGEIPNLTFAACLERYDREVSARKKGARWESVRLEALGRDRLALVKLRSFGPAHVSDWRERRLQAVSGASVRREWNLLSHVCTFAVREWVWLRSNPFKGLSRPAGGKARTRIATQEEIDRLTAAASPGMGRVIAFAVETGMRAGEIAALRDVRGRVAYLPDSKNGTAREVPLSAAALEAWAGGIGLKASSISALFAQLCDICNIRGLTFHDLRATAATRLSKKLNALQLAKMLGHKDLRITMIYYRESTKDIANLL